MQKVVDVVLAALFQAMPAIVTNTPVVKNAWVATLHIVVEHQKPPMHGGLVSG